MRTGVPYGPFISNRDHEVTSDRFSADEDVVFRTQATANLLNRRSIRVHASHECQWLHHLFQFGEGFGFSRFLLVSSISSGRSSAALINLVLGDSGIVVGGGHAHTAVFFGLRWSGFVT